MWGTKAPFTYDDLIEWGHECNWGCKGRDVHSDIAYTYANGRATADQFIEYHVVIATLAGVEILDVRETLEVESWQEQSKRRKSSWSKREPDANDIVQAWVVTFRLMAETVGVTS